MKTIVKLEHVSKFFEKGKYIIKDLSLDINEGEFLTLLGPSGCGKTTILRLISGLDSVSEGKVFIDGVDVTDVSATKREVNTIFQNFALFPHMTVFENVSFGLKMRKESLEYINREVKKALKLVELNGFEDRYPGQLSGGQQQRVAIARGIVMHPKVLLLDESLCSLDLKLKRMMQIELKKLQKKLGLTFIYVTHDQDEALTMSDRIVIINDGKIQQDDTPQNIYQKPKTAFVADFIGESNLIKFSIADINNDKVVVNNNGMDFVFDAVSNDKVGDKVFVMIRPEDINIFKNSVKDGLRGFIKEMVYDGVITKLVVVLDNKLSLKVTVKGGANYETNDEVYLKIDQGSLILIRE